MAFGRRKDSRGSSRPLSTILPDGLKFFASRASNTARRLQPTASRVEPQKTVSSGVFPGTAYRDSRRNSIAPPPRRQSDNESMLHVHHHPPLPPTPPLDNTSLASTRDTPLAGTRDSSLAKTETATVQPTPVQPFEPLTLDLDSHTGNLGLPQELLGSSESLPSIRPVADTTLGDTTAVDTTANSSDTADISLSTTETTEPTDNFVSATSLPLSFVPASAAASSSSTIVEHGIAEPQEDSLASTVSSTASVDGMSPPPLKHESPEIRARDDTESDEELYHLVPQHKSLSPVVMSCANERKILVNRGVYIFGEHTLGRELAGSCVEDGFEAYDFE